MNKKLLAVAVAGVFAAPAAFAQSNVTISGAIVMSVDNLKYGQPAATRANTSEGRLNDESSSLIFSVREDLGSGMAALVRLDYKFNVDSSAGSMSGASWIGLDTKDAGRFTAGRHNLHFFKTPWDGYGLSGSLKLHPTSLIDFAGSGATATAGSGGVAIANATRTANSLMWSSPKWGGLTMDVGYSFNPLGAGASEADLTPVAVGGSTRKGQAWTLNPTFSGKDWSVAYSYWSGKADAPTGALAAYAAGAAGATAQLNAADQRSDSVYGHYEFPGTGFKLGVIWNKSRLNAAGNHTGGLATGTELTDRTAWSIPIRYRTGNHNFLAHYTRADDNKATPLVSDGAKMWTLMYAYTLSKRTSVSVAYAKITNDVGAAYNFFTNASGGGLASVNSGSGLGEDPSLLSFGMRHNF